MNGGPLKKDHWASAGEILRVWKYRAGLDSDRILILNQIWEREAGHLSRHWTLSGVRRGTIYVQVKSPAAAQELQLRSRELVRSLNKYFKKAWIKDIRPARG
jgi:hypothetical protein